MATGDAKIDEAPAAPAPGIFSKCNATVQWTPLAPSATHHHHQMDRSHFCILCEGIVPFGIFFFFFSYIMQTCPISFPFYLLLIFRYLIHSLKHKLQTRTDSNVSDLRLTNGSEGVRECIESIDGIIPPGRIMSFLAGFDIMRGERFNKTKSIFLPNANQKSVRNAVPTRSPCTLPVSFRTRRIITVRTIVVTHQHILFTRRLRVPFAFDAFHLKWRAFQRDASSSFALPSISHYVLVK